MNNSLKNILNEIQKKSNHDSIEKEKVGSTSPFSNIKKEFKPSLMSGELFDNNKKNDLLEKVIIENSVNDFKKLAGLTDCTCDDTKINNEPETDDYTDLTNLMIQRINSGEHYLEVINDLARLYSSTHSNSYDAFDFAHDALSRRAWEMGVWPKEKINAISQNNDEDETDFPLINDINNNLNNNIKEKTLGLGLERRAGKKKLTNITRRTIKRRKTRRNLQSTLRKLLKGIY